MLWHHRSEPVLYPKHLPDEIRIQVLGDSAGGEPVATARREPEAATAAVEPWKEYRRQALNAAEERYLRELLQTTGANVAKASRASGLSPSRLYDLLRKYNLPTRA